MTRFQNRIAIWSSLHELVLIYGSSYGSIFESLSYRVHNGTNLNQVRVSATGPKYCSMQPNIQININTC